MSIEAMRLADELDCRGMNRPSWKDQFDAGYELRRLHKENIELRQAIEQANVAASDTSQERVDEMQKQRHEQAQKQEPVACGGEQEAPYIGHDCAPYMTDSMKVFCPVCCTKFRAIPPDVQKLLLDAGFEPPFDTPAPQRQPLTDEQISDLWCKVSNTDFVTADTHEFARAIEAAHGIKEKNT